MAIGIYKTTRVYHEIKFVEIKVPLREDDLPADYPGVDGEQWKIRFDIETGQIIDFPGYAEAIETCIKARDAGVYEFLDEQGTCWGAIEEDYVPGFFPGCHYGDYIEFKINESGVITNWRTPSDDELEELGD